MTSILGDETALLLAIRLPDEDPDHREAALEKLSEAVITRLALKAKADSYQFRIDRWLAIAANLGTDLDELAAAAGMSLAEARQRLAATADGLLTDTARRRLGIELPQTDLPAGTRFKDAEPLPKTIRSAGAPPSPWRFGRPFRNRI